MIFGRITRQFRGIDAPGRSVSMDAGDFSWPTIFRFSLFTVALILCFHGPSPLLAGEERLNEAALDFIDRLFALDLEKGRLGQRMKALAKGVGANPAELKKLFLLPIPSAIDWLRESPGDDYGDFVDLRRGLLETREEQAVFAKLREQYGDLKGKFDAIFKDFRSRSLQPIVESLDKWVEELEIELTLFISKGEDLAGVESALKERFSDLSLATKFQEMLRTFKKRQKEYKENLLKQEERWGNEIFNFPTVEWVKFSDRLNGSMPLSKILLRCEEELGQAHKMQQGLGAGMEGLLARTLSIRRLFGAKVRLFAGYLPLFQPLETTSLEIATKLKDYLDYVVSIPKVTRKEDFRELLNLVVKFFDKLKTKNKEVRGRLMSQILSINTIRHKWEQEVVNYLVLFLDTLESLSRIQRMNQTNLAIIRRGALFIPLFQTVPLFQMMEDLEGYLRNGGGRGSDRFKNAFAQFNDYSVCYRAMDEALLKDYAELRSRSLDTGTVLHYLKSLMVSLENHETRFLTHQNKFREALGSATEEINDKLTPANELRRDFFARFRDLARFEALNAIFVDRIKNKKLMQKFQQLTNDYLALLLEQEKELDAAIEKEDLARAGKETEMQKVARVARLKVDSRGEKLLNEMKFTRESLRKILELEIRRVEGRVREALQASPLFERGGEATPEGGKGEGEEMLTVRAAKIFDPLKDKGAQLTEGRVAEYLDLLDLTLAQFDTHIPLEKLFNLTLKLEKILADKRRGEEALFKNLYLKLF